MSRAQNHAAHYSRGLGALQSRITDRANAREMMKNLVGHLYVKG